jgi:hypothetical protein
MTVETDRPYPDRIPELAAAAAATAWMPGSAWPACCWGS